MVENSRLSTIACERLKFKAFMMFKVPSSPRDGMDENRIYNHIGFFARTGVTKNLSGEVAPEGK